MLIYGGGFCGVPTSYNNDYYDIFDATTLILVGIRPP